MCNLHVDDSQGNNRYNMILVHDIFYKINMYLCLSNNTNRLNGGAYKGCTYQRKDVSKINYGVSSEWLNDESFGDEELWDSDHVMDITQFTRFILDYHYKKVNLRKITS